MRSTIIITIINVQRFFSRKENVSFPHTYFVTRFIVSYLLSENWKEILKLALISGRLENWNEFQIYDRVDECCGRIFSAMHQSFGELEWKIKRCEALAFLWFQIRMKIYVWAAVTSPPNARMPSWEVLQKYRWALWSIVSSFRRLIDSLNCNQYCRRSVRAHTVALALTATQRKFIN